jgi:hypothetical protein
MSWQHRLKKQLGWEATHQDGKTITVRSPSNKLYIVAKNKYCTYIPYKSVSKHTIVASSELVPGAWKAVHGFSWVPTMVSRLKELETTPKPWRSIPEEFTLSPEASASYSQMLVKSINQYIATNNLPAAKEVFVSDFAYQLHAKDMLFLIANTYLYKELLSVYRENYARATIEALVANRWSVENATDLVKAFV